MCHWTPPPRRSVAVPAASSRLLPLLLVLPLPWPLPPAATGTATTASRAAAVPAAARNPVPRCPSLFVMSPSPSVARTGPRTSIEVVHLPKTTQRKDGTCGCMRAGRDRGACRLSAHVEVDAEQY